VVLLEELLNAALSNRAAGVAPLIFGVMLVAMILWRPQGMVSLFKNSKGRSS
jgi:branched-chain amino acid transport system permease protein